MLNCVEAAEVTKGQHADERTQSCHFELTSSPMMKTLSSLTISSSRAEFKASRTVNCNESIGISVLHKRGHK